MLFSKLLLVLVISTSLFSNQNDEKKIVEVGMAASSLLKSTLTGKMKKVLKNKNRLELVEFCATQAQKITKGVNEILPDGVSVKRVSLKNRSKYNAPNDLDKKVIERLMNRFDKKRKDNIYEVEKVENGYNLYRPIVLKKGCLKCHGKKNSMAENIKAKINELYPKDKAYDYLKGDFRGVFVVNIDKNIYK